MGEPASPAHLQAVVVLAGIAWTIAGFGMGMAYPTFSLTAQAGYIQMPDMNTVYMWSYGSPDFQHPVRAATD